MRIVACLMLLLALGVPAETFAQTPSTNPAAVLTPGTRVRVISTVVPRRVPGLLSEVTESMVTIIPDGSMPIRIPTGSITSIEVSLGRRRNVLQGVAIGVATGIALGFAFPVDADTCGPDSANFCSRGEAIGGSIMVFGGLGTAIGAIVTSERWAPMSLGVRTTTAAGRPAAMMVLSVRF